MWNDYTVNAICFFFSLPVEHHLCNDTCFPFAGSLFCAYGIFSVISQFLGAMLFNNVYLTTLGHTFNGFVFLLCAAVKIIPLCFLW